MHPILKSFAALAFAAAPPALPAAAKAETEAVIAAPVFSQIVTMPVPPGFHDAHEVREPPAYIHEIIPAGETPERWSQMITLTGSQGLATADPARDATRLAGLLGGRYLEACPHRLVGVKLAAPAVAGARAVFAGFLGCGSYGPPRAGAPAGSEAMVFLVMVGAQDVYTLQWAERSPAVPGKMAFNRPLWESRLARLAAGARICDKVAGERPPYTSCTSG